MRLLFTILLLLALTIPVRAQIDSLPGFDPGQQLEDLLQDSDTDVDFDFNTLYEGIEYYLEHPLNLNEANRYELKDLQLLSDLQIDRFLAYRETAGPLLSVYELQIIPGFDMETVRRIMPLVRIQGGLDDFNVPLHHMLLNGRNELYLRWKRVLEDQKGFIPAEDSSLSRYQGDKNGYYVRFKHAYENRFSWGFTAEKDPGEEFFTGSNPNGFDFYSAHMFLRDYNKTIRAVALGDYSVSLGQGLIMNTGFGYNKGAYTMDVKRSGRVLRPFTSVNETSFFRGAAATLQFGDLSATVFGSRLRRDGNLVTGSLDELDNEIILNLSSLLNSGLHRTPNEIADEDAFLQHTVGGNLRWRANKGQLNLNAVYDQLDISLVRNPRPYNQFYFHGDRLLNLSLDYSYRWNNFSFFGETGYSSNGSMATTNGVLMGLDRKVDVSVLYRNFPKDFQTFHGNAFAETAGNRNEEGLYIGTEIRPTRNFLINAYYDLWRHPWLRFRADAPSIGNEWLVRFTYFRKRKFTAYLQLRTQNRQENRSNNETKIDELVWKRLSSARLHFSYQIAKTLELRSRLGAGYFQNGPDEPLATGIILYQDVLYRPIASPFSFTARLALFDTDGYAIRFYAYENDLIYNFSIPAYYDEGSRFYINLRYKGIRNMTLEARYARSYFPNLQSISSGLNEIQGKPAPR